MDPLLQLTPLGLYCPEGNFYIDPTRPVPYAIVTHAHSDHLRRGCEKYLVANDGIGVARLRLAKKANVREHPYGEPLTINGVRVSLHPSGHMLGSAQVRLERKGAVAVVAGDYKRHSDPTCKDFEVVRCHLFVTESTFGMPMYRWPDPGEVIAEIDTWRKANQAAGRVSVLRAYSIGKAQRLLSALKPETGPIYVHDTIEEANAAYRAAGVTALPETIPMCLAPIDTDWPQATVVTMPGTDPFPPELKQHRIADATVSGWNLGRGGYRGNWGGGGFILSDHVDDPGIFQTIRDVGAERVWVEHGYTKSVVRRLLKEGLDAVSLDVPLSDGSMHEFHSAGVQGRHPAKPRESQGMLWDES